MNRTRIILADDQQVLMDAIRKLLEPYYDVAGTFTDGHALVEAAPILLPDLVILETGMNGLNGLCACTRIKKLRPRTKIIFLTKNHDIETVGEAFRAGASGYVLKTSAASELIAAIREVLRGGYFATPCLTEGMQGSFVQKFKSLKGPVDITVRQKEVLRLLVEGNSMKKVASLLNITPRTVAFHKYSMMEQLEIQSSAQLISYATKSAI